jgi:hypothetical protein
MPSSKRTLHFIARALSTLMIYTTARTTSSTTGMIGTVPVAPHLAVTTTTSISKTDSLKA